MKHTLVILLAVAVVSVSANLSKNVVSNSVSTNKNRRHISSPNIIAKKVSKSPSAVATATTGGSSDLSSSILNLAKTILGAGVLSLPSGIALFSDSKQATIPAIALLAFMGLASAYSFSSVGKACQLHGVGSFAEAFAKSLGLSSGRAISTVITLKTFFACLAYSIIIGKQYIYKYDFEYAHIYIFLDRFLYLIFFGVYSSYKPYLFMIYRRFIFSDFSIIRGPTRTTVAHECDRRICCHCVAASMSTQATRCTQVYEYVRARRCVVLRVLRRLAVLRRQLSPGRKVLFAD